MSDNRRIYHTHISSKHRWYDLKIREVWQYRDLIILFTHRNFVLTFKQTILGPIWIFLNPFLTSIVFSIVFGEIANIETGKTPSLLFYLCSNAVWAFFAECVNKNTAIFVTNAHVFGKVYFPRMTVPISNTISSAIRLGIQMLMIAVFFVYYYVNGNIEPNWKAWWMVPIVLIQLGTLGMSIGILISSLTTKYRDLFIVVGFGISLLMYATPVVYPLSQVEDGIIKTCVLLNPVTSVIEIFRYAVLGEGTIMLGYYFLSVMVTLFLAIGGLAVFSRVEKTFMDTV